MKKLFSVVSLLAFCFTLSAQSLVTGVQYLGAAAAQDAARKKQAELKGEKPKTKVAFQMNIDVSGRVHWGYVPVSNVGSYADADGNTHFITAGGNNTFTGGPAANVDLGVRFNNEYFVGVGAQIGANFGRVRSNKEDDKGENRTIRVLDTYLPIYGVFKIYIPSRENVCPYIDFAFGGYLPDWYQFKSDLFSEYELNFESASFKDAKIEDKRLNARAAKGGFYFHGAAGVDMNQINVSAGYEMTTATDDGNTRLFHNIFLKIGFRIGG